MKVIQSWLYSIVIAVAAALFINIFLFQQIIVEGRSMEPTLENHEHIVISKLGHTLKQTPDYDAIVVLDSRIRRERKLQDDLIEPVNNWVQRQDYIYIKRVVGRPGDVMRFSDGKVYRNDVALAESYIKEPMKYSNDQAIKVPENHVFVLGDNRNNSSDSRFMGTIPVDHVTGVMIFKLY
jgi:signal peptidase I